MSLLLLLRRKAATVGPITPGQSVTTIIDLDATFVPRATLQGTFASRAALQATFTPRASFTVEVSN